MESPELDGLRKDVWHRLYGDSQRKNNSRTHSQENTQDPPKRSGPRNNIEQDLYARDKLLQAKKRAQCAARKAQERRELTGVPELNAISRRLVNNPQRAEPEAPVKAVEHVGSALRTRKAAATDNFSTLLKDNDTPSLDVRVNLSKFHLSLSQRKFDGQEKDSQLATGGQNHVGLHSQMNALPVAAAPDAKPPKYLEGEKDVVKRTMYWKEKKDERVKKQADAKQEQELDGCTFKPLTNQTRTGSAQVSSRRSGRASRTFEKQCMDARTGIHYSNLSPTQRKLGYSSGFNMPAFVNKAQPMLDYKALAPTS